VKLPDFSQLSDKAAYAESFRLQYANNDCANAMPLAERYAEGLVLVQNPPQRPLTQAEMDEVCELPYMRDCHPGHGAAGVPAAEEVKFSLTSCRGCFGGCAFCALTSHQGRYVTGRSKASLIREARSLAARADFKGYIHDVGGPTANFRKRACAKQDREGACKHRECLFPEPCPDLEVDHGELLDILRSLRALPGVKKVFIRSGLRHDYLMADKNREAFLRELCGHHVSGILKVAPEHIAEGALRRMRKPAKEVYERFAQEYAAMNKELSKDQYLLPYFISSHPGSSLEDAIDLALYLKASGFAPDQVQDFYPTPGTAATCMYYTGIDPGTGESVQTAVSAGEKRMQRALLHFWKDENRGLALTALKLAGREGDAARLFPGGRANGAGGGRRRGRSDSGHGRRR
jgi:uncharacterized radical SAM protein YgiQ